MSLYYDFVNFLGVRSYKAGAKLQGRMSLKLETLSPIFIGSGYEDLANGRLYKTFIRYKDRYIIPGSSLKGVVRTISQAVSYSCVQVSRNMIKKMPFTTVRNCNCISCQMYGRMGLKGRIIFRDFILVSGTHTIINIPLQMEPNINKDVYYENGKFRGIKLYRHGNYKDTDGQIPVESVEAGSIFQGETLFEGIDQEQLQLLCYSLGLDRSFMLKIGGNKAGFFGSCSIEVNNAVVNKEDFSPFEYASKYAGNDARIVQNKNKLSEILKFDNASNAGGEYGDK